MKTDLEVDEEDSGDLIPTVPLPGLTAAAGEGPGSSSATPTTTLTAINLGVTPPPAKRKRADLTPKIKKEICLFKESNPTLTQNSVCLYAERALGVRIGRSTVCDILKDKEKWIALGDIAVSTRIRRPKHEELENALSAWYAEMTAGDSQLTICDDLLRDQAKLLGRQLGIDDFQYSNGWLSRFKARRGLHLARMERAAAAAAVVAAANSQQQSEDLAGGGSGPACSQQPQREPDYQKELNHLLASYSADNVYYCEALDLAYRLEWHRQRSPDSVSLLLATNLSGSDRRPPTVVWRRQRARCFGPAFDPNQLCDWRPNEAAAMTPVMFAEWLTGLDTECQETGRRVLLLCHVPPEFVLHGVAVTNVTACQVPAWPSAAAVAAGCAAEPFSGIQQHFRCLMGFQQLSRLLEDLEAFEEASDGPPGMDVKQALYCLRDAWAEFRVEVLLERLHAVGLSLAPDPGPQPRPDLEARLNLLLGHAEDDPGSGAGLVPAGAGEEADDSEPPQVVSPEEARRAIDRLLLFVEQHMGDGPNQFSVLDLDTLRGARRRCLQLRREEARKEKQLMLAGAARAPVKLEYADIRPPE